MPDPPSVSSLTYYLFDNPWPLTVVLVVIAIVMAVSARRSGRRDLLRAAAIPAILAIIVLATGYLVTTSGERAGQIARRLVAAAEQADVPGAMGLFSDDAMMALIDPRNPGVGIKVIRDRVELVEGRYRIDSARITSLKTYSAAGDRGVAHLRVTASFSSAYGYPTPSSWVIEVRPDDDGQWKITHITFVEYNFGQRPGMHLFR